MAKVTGPLMSLEASGSIASTIVFSRWKGRPYVRQLVKPSNPKTPAQTAFRAMFGFLSSQWKMIDPASYGNWSALAAQGNYSQFNAYTKYNQDRWTQTLTPTEDPTATPSTVDVVTSYTATGGVKQGELSIVIANVHAANWGVIIYLSKNTGFTPTQNDVVQVIAGESGDTVASVISGLETGTYYTRVATFTIDGAQLLNATEHNFVVT